MESRAPLPAALVDKAHPSFDLAQHLLVIWAEKPMEVAQ
jgi:hypothetical protein